MPPLCSDDRRALLALARRVIRETVLHNRIPDLPVFHGRLAEPSGAFVTLRRGGRLRGCVGSAERGLALGEAAAQAAAGAALRDARFPVLTAADLPAIEIEISVLSELRPVLLDAVEAGRHGLLAVSGERRGLLLPQVAVERAWTAQRFVEETCRKAGLDPQAWRLPETELLAFTAEVFSERAFRPAGADEKKSPPLAGTGSGG